MSTLSLLLCGSSVRILSSQGAWWAPWGQEVSSVDCCIPRAWSSAWHPMHALVIVTKWMRWTISWSRTSAFSEIICMFVCMSQCHFYNFFLALSTSGTHLAEIWRWKSMCTSYRRWTHGLVSTCLSLQLVSPTQIHFCKNMTYVKSGNH